MLKRILMVCLAALFLLVTFVIPVVAAVPEDQQSMVNFLDYTALDGSVGSLHSESVGDLGVSFVLTWSESDHALMVEWEDTFEAGNLDTYYMIIDGYTYADVAPNMSAYAYSQGAYFGSASGDFGYSYCYFGNSDFDSISNSASMTYQDLMQDDVVFIFTEASNIEYLSYLEYPAIYQDYNGRLSDFDSVMWSGESYYFWTPYNEAYFEVDNSDQAYQEGYQAGYQQGYDDLYADAGVGEFDILSTATYTLEFIGEVDITLPWNPIVYAGGVSFKNFDYSVVESINPDTCYVHLTWDDANVWNWGVLPFGVDGNSLIQYLRIVTTDGKSYSAYADQVSGYRPFVLDLEQTISYPIEVKELIVMVGRPEDLLYEFDLITSNKFYNNGYSAGYLEGIKADSQDAYTEGFRLGREEGYIVGKAEGLELAAQGDWRNLFISVVEAPLHVFNSLFNFEVLGLDMRDFMASMFTLCLVVLVFDKFLGGI